MGQLVLGCPPAEKEKSKPAFPFLLLPYYANELQALTINTAVIRESFILEKILKIESHPALPSPTLNHVPKQLHAF